MKARGRQVQCIIAADIVAKCPGFTDQRRVCESPNRPVNEIVQRASGTRFRQSACNDDAAKNRKDLCIEQLRSNEIHLVDDCGGALSDLRPQ